jgi:hypothetical protein
MSAFTRTLEVSLVARRLGDAASPYPLRTRKRSARSVPAPWLQLPDSRPTFIDAHRTLAHVLRQQGKLLEAADHFDEAERLGAQATPAR